MGLELGDLSWHRLLEDVDVAQSAEISISPGVNHAIRRHSPRVVVPRLDMQRHLSIIVRLKGAWI